MQLETVGFDVLLAFRVSGEKTPHGMLAMQGLNSGKQKGYLMNRALGLACLAGGIILLIFGIQQSNSFTSNVSRTFTGSPTNNSMWMIIGGIVIGVFGLILALRGGSGTRT